jgi:hypothetical protein
MSIQETDIKLPRQNDNVFIQLTAKGTTPADASFVIFVFPPGSNNGRKVMPANGHCQLNTQYDLGATVNSLVDSIVMCSGGVIFKQKDTFKLTSEFFVAGNKLPDSGTTTVSGD